jgi:serine/threonine protein kinase
MVSCVVVLYSCIQLLFEYENDINTPLALELDNLLAKDQQQQQQQQGGDRQTRFRNLLKMTGIISVSDAMMDIILKYYATSVLVINTPTQARAIYNEAVLLPRSVTQVILQEQNGISVAELFKGSDPSKAVLLHAHECGNPRILKIATQLSIEHELEVWNAVADYNEQHSAHLVPLRKLEFARTQIEIGDMSGGASVQYTRSGLLMTHYQGTLTQCKIPLTEEVVLHFGQQLLKAVRALHTVGYCHLDIKPSNIFLLDTRMDGSLADCFLGDYGAAAKIGHYIRERTVKYYPLDGSFDAEEITDMYLLAVTILEKFGSIPKASERPQMTRVQIRGAIAAVESDAVRTFLLSLFVGMPAEDL